MRPDGEHARKSRHHRRRIGDGFAASLTAGRRLDVDKGRSRDYALFAGYLPVQPRLEILEDGGRKFAREQGVIVIGPQAKRHAILCTTEAKDQATQDVRLLRFQPPKTGEITMIGSAEHLAQRPRCDTDNALMHRI